MKITRTANTLYQVETTHPNRRRTFDADMSCATATQSATACNLSPAEIGQLLAIMANLDKHELAAIYGVDYYDQRQPPRMARIAATSPLPPRAPDSRGCG